MAMREHLCSAWLLQRVLAPSLLYDIRFNRKSWMDRCWRFELPSVNRKIKWHPQLFRKSLGEMESANQLTWFSSQHLSPGHCCLPAAWGFSWAFWDFSGLSHPCILTFAGVAAVPLLSLCCHCRGKLLEALVSCLQSWWMLWRGGRELVSQIFLYLALFGMRAGNGSVLSRGGDGGWGRLHVTPWASEWCKREWLK